MAHKPISPVTYVSIYAVLLGLTALTVYIATRGHMGVWEVPIALGIATAKTILVGLFFMHLVHSTRLTWLVIAAGVLFLAIMIALTMADYATRTWVPVRGVAIRSVPLLVGITEDAAHSPTGVRACPANREPLPYLSPC